MQYAKQALNSHLIHQYSKFQFLVNNSFIGWIKCNVFAMSKLTCYITVKFIILVSKSRYLIGVMSNIKKQPRKYLKHKTLPGGQVARVLGSIDVVMSVV